MYVFRLIYYCAHNNETTKKSLKIHFRLLFRSETFGNAFSSPKDGNVFAPPFQRALSFEMIRSLPVKVLFAPDVAPVISISHRVLLEISTSVTCNYKVENML